ncbi:MAG TPA: hypothetical protein VJ521_05645, partial [Acidobacteriota bacterium]|nr:hypothetical protein [Acidobacteriota bacterium]
QKKIPSFEVVFKPMLQPGEWEISEPQEEDFDSLFTGGKAATAVKVESSDRVKLSREEDAVFRLVNAKNTVSDIIESSKLGEFHTCKALYDLYERKIIDPVSQPRRPDVATAPKIVVVRAEKTLNLNVLYPILAVIVAGLVVLNAADPLKLTALNFFQPSDRTELFNGLNKSKMNLVDSALVMYFYVNGTLPKALEELVSKRYLKASDIIDPWNRPYAYGSSANTYILAAHNADGQLDQRSQIRRALDIAEQEEPQKEIPPSSDIRFEEE